MSDILQPDDQSDSLSDNEQSPRIFSGSNEDQVTENAQTGRWKDEEHLMFIEGLKRHGRDWKALALEIPTRTVVQIRTHAQKYFSKIQKSIKLGELNILELPPGHELLSFKGELMSSKRRSKAMSEDWTTTRYPAVSPPSPFITHNVHPLNSVPSNYTHPDIDDDLASLSCYFEPTQPSHRTDSFVDESRMTNLFHTQSSDAFKNNRPSTKISRSLSEGAESLRADIAKYREFNLSGENVKESKPFSEYRNDNHVRAQNNKVDLPYSSFSGLSMVNSSCSSQFPKSTPGLTVNFSGKITDKSPPYTPPLGEESVGDRSTILGTLVNTNSSLLARSRDENISDNARTILSVTSDDNTHINSLFCSSPQVQMDQPSASDRSTYNPPANSKSNDIRAVERSSISSYSIHHRILEVDEESDIDWNNISHRRSRLNDSPTSLIEHTLGVIDPDIALNEKFENDQKLKYFLTSGRTQFAHSTLTSSTNDATNSLGNLDDFDSSNIDPYSTFRSVLDPIGNNIQVHSTLKAHPYSNTPHKQSFSHYQRRTTSDENFEKSHPSNPPPNYPLAITSFSSFNGSSTTLLSNGYNVAENGGTHVEIDPRRMPHSSVPATLQNEFAVNNKAFLAKANLPVPPSVDLVRQENKRVDDPTIPTTSPTNANDNNSLFMIEGESNDDVRKIMHSSAISLQHERHAELQIPPNSAFIPTKRMPFIDAIGPPVSRSREASLSGDSSEVEQGGNNIAPTVRRSPPSSIIGFESPYSLPGQNSYGKEASQRLKTLQRSSTNELGLEYESDSHGDEPTIGPQHLFSPSRQNSVDSVMQVPVFTEEQTRVLSKMPGLTSLMTSPSRGEALRRLTPSNVPGLSGYSDSGSYHSEIPSESSGSVVYHARITVGRTSSDGRSRDVSISSDPRSTDGSSQAASLNYSQTFESQGVERDARPSKELSGQAGGRVGGPNGHETPQVAENREYNIHSHPPQEHPYQLNHVSYIPPRPQTEPLPVPSFHAISEPAIEARGNSLSMMHQQLRSEQIIPSDVPPLLQAESSNQISRGFHSGAFHPIAALATNISVSKSAESVQIGSSTSTSTSHHGFTPQSSPLLATSLGPGHSAAQTTSSPSQHSVSSPLTKRKSTTDFSELRLSSFRLSHAESDSVSQATSPRSPTHTFHLSLSSSSGSHNSNSVPPSLFQTSTSQRASFSGYVDADAHESAPLKPAPRDYTESAASSLNSTRVEGEDIGTGVFTSTGGHYRTYQSPWAATKSTSSLDAAKTPLQGPIFVQTGESQLERECSTGGSGDPVTPSLSGGGRCSGTQTQSHVDSLLDQGPVFFAEEPLVDLAGLSKLKLRRR